VEEREQGDVGDLTFRFVSVGWGVGTDVVGDVETVVPRADVGRAGGSEAVTGLQRRGGGPANLVGSSGKGPRGVDRR
jgi:hypothetical protein